MEGPEEATVVASWTAHVAADPSGVPWDRGQAGEPGEAVRSAERCRCRCAGCV